MQRRNCNLTQQKRRRNCSWRKTQQTQEPELEPELQELAPELQEREPALESQPLEPELGPESEL